MREGQECWDRDNPQFSSALTLNLGKHLGHHRFTAFGKHILGRKNMIHAHKKKVPKKAYFSKFSPKMAYFSRFSAKNGLFW